MALTKLTALSRQHAHAVAVELRHRGYEAGTHGWWVYSTAGEWLVAKLIAEVSPQVQHA